MKNLDKNSKGFISLNLSLILSIFISLYFTGAFAIAISQQRDYVRSTCVNEATDLQAATLKNVRYLFSFNKPSTILRRSITAAKITLALAVATMDAPLVAATEKILNGLYRSQDALDKIQKAIIFKARAELGAKHVALTAKINSGQWDEAKPWNKMISMLSFFRPKGFPKLAIRPDSEGGVAPNYEWEPDAEKKLTLAYSWNMFFKTEDDYQTILQWMNTIKVECSVAPNLKEDKWQLTINADK